MERQLHQGREQMEIIASLREEHVEIFTPVIRIMQAQLTASCFLRQLISRSSSSCFICYCADIGNTMWTALLEELPVAV